MGFLICVEASEDGALAIVHQLGRRIMMLEIDDHSGPPPEPNSCANRVHLSVTAVAPPSTSDEFERHLTPATPFPEDRC